jgi:hypothetical protein
MKTRTALTFLTMAISLMTSSLAVAQAKPPGGETTSEDGATYKAKTVYDFDDDNVEGDLQRPDGELINSLNNVKHDSLIEIRKDFIPEMLKSLEDM